MELVKIIKENLRHSSIGCPKYDDCNIHQPEAETCIYGPYKYCGKYRSLIEQKNR
jgi:hypothetical protein